MDTKKTTNPSADIKSLIGQIEAKCDLYLVTKAPYSLPENIKEMVVKYGPYVSLVIIIISFPAILTALGLSAVFMPLSYFGGLSRGVFSTISGLILMVTIILQLIALPGLFKRAASSWRLMFYSSLINAIYQIITFNLGGLIIGTLLSLYILFQIKSYYH